MRFLEKFSSELIKADQNYKIPRISSFCWAKSNRENTNISKMNLMLFKIHSETSKQIPEFV